MNFHEEGVSFFDQVVGSISIPSNMSFVQVHVLLKEDGIGDLSAKQRQRCEHLHLHFFVSSVW